MSNTIQAITYKSGSYITVEGEASAHAFYIVQEGTVALSQDLTIPGQGTIKLRAGDFFEVESALTGKRKLFTAISITDCKVIVVPTAMYNDLIQKKPSLVQKIILSFSKKMRELDGILAKISFKQNHDNAVSIDHLLDVGDYYYNEQQLQPAALAYHHFVKSVTSHSKLEHATSQLQKIKESAPNDNLFLEESSSDLLCKMPEGTMVFSEAMPGNTMYFIQSGSVKICKIANNSEITLAMLQKGDLFGEMALLENKPRSATAITAQSSALLVISYQNFPAIIKKQPTLITRITTVLASRIWFVYRQIANVMLPEGQGRIYDALMLFMEKQGLAIKNKSVTLHMTVKDFLHHIGMGHKTGLEKIKEIVSANAIRIKSDDTIEILNPQFVQNRSIHFREAQKHIKKKKQ